METQQNTGYHVTSHKKPVSQTRVKSDPAAAFCLGPRFEETNTKELRILHILYLKMRWYEVDENETIICWNLMWYFRPVHSAGVVCHVSFQPFRAKGLLQNQDDGAETLLRQTKLGNHRSQRASQNFRWEINWHRITSPNKSSIYYEWPRSQDWSCHKNRL